jgi:DNA (cytosine-5)-methyltransferase 1
MRDTESGHLTVGGLFSGIGGWELGLERAGMRVLWHCEADPYARAVLERHWPGVPCYPDVRELRGADVEPVDLLCGGFPCQDLSYAGAGAGIDGARSGLWSEYARLVGELRPRYVLVENVAALLARGLGRVLGDLAALGYDAEWDCIPASAVGAPHRRDRVWLVAYPNGDDGGPGRPGRPAASGSGQPVAERSLQDGADSDRGRLQERSERDRWQAQPALEAPLGRDADGLRSSVGDAASVGRHGPSAAGPGEHQERESAGTAGGSGCDVGGAWWRVEPDVGRVAHGVPARVDRLAALGNALVPQIAEWIGGRVTAFEESRLAQEATSASLVAAGLHGKGQR